MWETKGNYKWIGEKGKRKLKSLRKIKRKLGKIRRINEIH